MTTEKKPKAKTPPKPNKTQYGIWTSDNLFTGGTLGEYYWLFYDDLETAVVESQGKLPVYKFTARCLGRFERVTKLKPIREGKCPKKKSKNK